jgi:ectoine hydroxylase-related dioxygenase (phytanoyl-CoA dioxygenase family)
MQPLSENERYRFECHGYLLLPDVLSSDEVDTINAVADAHLEAFRHEYTERAPATLQHASMLEGTEGFDPLIWHPNVLGRVDALLGGEAAFVETSVILKDGNTPAHTGWHRDIGPGGVDLASATLAVSAIYYLSDVAADGGAFAVVPGSHKFPFRLPKLESIEEMPYYEVLAAPAGSAILFHGALWHTATPNNSDTQRRTVHNYYFRRWMKKTVHTVIPERLYAQTEGDPVRSRVLYCP